MNKNTQQFHHEQPIQQSSSPKLVQKYQKKSNLTKNQYAGLTLMEYFKMSNSDAGLQQIDEQSNSSISVATPHFEQRKDKINIVSGSKMGRRDKLRTQSYQQSFPILKQAHAQVLSKVTTINFDQFHNLDKNIIKLPCIHQNRHINNSRQSIFKDGKINTKRQPWRTKNEQNNNQYNHSTFNKQVQKSRIDLQIQKNAQIYKKSIRSRVTSSFFYQPKTKQREKQRVKTQQEIIEKNLQKTFIVTKYGATNVGIKKNKQEIHIKTLKRNENTIKVVRNSNG